MVVPGLDLLQEMASLLSVSAAARSPATSAASPAPARNVAASRGSGGGSGGGSTDSTHAAASETGLAAGGGAGLRARVLLLSAGQAPPRGLAADRIIIAPEEVLRRAAGVQSAKGVGAVAELYRPASVLPTVQQAPPVAPTASASALPACWQCSHLACSGRHTTRDAPRRDQVPDLGT